MSTNKVYVWYSSASDVTGIKIAETIGCDHGKKTPNPTEYNVVINWGAKAGTKYEKNVWRDLVRTGNLRRLNSVETIAANRDKVASLTKLQSAGIRIPGFLSGDNLNLIAINKAIAEGILAYPLLFIAKPSPVICMNSADLSRVFCSVKDLYMVRSLYTGSEYRVHVINGQVKLCQKKVLAKDPVKALTSAYARDYLRKAKKSANGNSPTPSQEELELIYQPLAQEMLSGPGHLLQSVGRGYELQSVGNSFVPASIQDVAIAAISALGLDFGAVSISLATSGTNASSVPAVTGVTTAPALTPEDVRDHYVPAFKKFIDSKSGRKVVYTAAIAAKIATTKAAESAGTPETIARLISVVQGLTITKAKKVLALLEED